MPGGCKTDSVRRSDGHRLISIQGLFGSGKTTTAKLLANRFGAELVLDGHNQNPFLAKFYTDPDRYSVETELFFMAMYYHRFKDLDPGRDAVSDFSLGTCATFLRARHSGAELDALLGIRGYLATQVPTPDLTIYLDVSVDTALERIAQRGRPMERDFSRALLERLDAEYKVDLSALGHRVEVLKIAASESPQQVLARATKAVGALSGGELGL